MFPTKLNILLTPMGVKLTMYCVHDNCIFTDWCLFPNSEPIDASINPVNSPMVRLHQLPCQSNYIHCIQSGFSSRISRNLHWKINLNKTVCIWSPCYMYSRSYLVIEFAVYKKREERGSVNSIH